MRKHVAFSIIKWICIAALTVMVCYGSFIIGRAVFVTVLEYKWPPRDVCNIYKPTANDILDCQATREAATTIANDR